MAEGRKGQWLTQGGRMGRRGMLRAGALSVGVTAGVLAAGGGSKNDSSSSSSSNSGSSASTGAQPTQAVAVQDQGTPKNGGTVTWRDIGVPAPLDPTNNTSYRSQDLAGF